MTVRDRTIVLVVAGVVCLAGFWFAALAPKRERAKTLSTQIATERGRLDRAEQAVREGDRAKRAYEAAYATVARLGKAVPVDDNVPSLLYQLEQAAQGAKIDFRSFKVSSATTTSPAPPPAAATSSAQPAGGTQPSGSSTATGTSSASPTPVPATQTAAAGLPPGAAVGPAGLPTMPFTFVFHGSFFDMERFLDEVNRFISIKRDKLRVQGRLLTIDAISLLAAPSGFPNVKATMSATAFLLPPGEGLLDGATPQGPATTTPPASGTTPAPPTATVTGVAR